ncbi:PAS domain S-box family protein [Trichomonas vaginalis G3]|uniref:PAS domain S-box family protein n=1 Tax=Trichomonas vaginalis (strain ATCC PRA-98 / G3) TaxID=412133 RepID=A2EN85_TRIV3|nr:guanylate cyclase protein [Trichomonas vaginalis G3]EAY05922.1 PAS domain S-box family protein [Trichomonas vaginalis G3]KAI5520187.1 guanylate cyclase protein [Trichomonas vaginalis G3]|eukprot:XP_001318145.1 PAS domain S-box family protein [Trichomonas vaginalis G3]
MNGILNSLALIGQGDNAYEAGPEIITEVSKINVCSNGRKVNEFNASLLDLLVFLAFDYNWIAGDLNLGMYKQNIFKDDFFCQATLNVNSVTVHSFQSLKSLLYYGLEHSQNYSKLFLIWLIAGAICISLAATVPVFLVILSYKNMVNKAMKMLLNLNASIKEQAKIQLRIDNLNNNDTLTAQIDRSHDASPSVVPLINFIIVVGIVVMYAFECNTAIKLNDSTSLFTKWFYLSAQRMVTINEIASNCVQLVLLGDRNLEQNVVDQEEMEERTEEYIHVLQLLTSILVNGNETLKASLGYDSTLDAYQISDTCDLGYNPRTVHDMYACTSLSKQLVMFESIIDNILKNHQNYGGSLNQEYPLNLLHILEFHIFPNILRVSDRIAELVENYFDQNMLIMLILTILGCALAFVNFLLSLSYRNQMITTYRLLLVLFQRLPPEVIINNKEILDFFTRKKKNDDEDKMSVAKSIVYKAKECIVITNENAIVEIVNQSYTDNTGIQPDQMLGQDILNFIAMEDNDKINQQIQLMLSGQGSLFWQDHIKLINDNNKAIPFIVQMIGMKDKENSTKVESIVFILTNEEEEIKK